VPDLGVFLTVRFAEVAAPGTGALQTVLLTDNRKFFLMTLRAAT